MRKNTFKPQISDDIIESVRNIVLNSTDVDILKYKKSFIIRRLTVRMIASDCFSAGEYIKIIAGDDNEVKKLLNLLTINVTQFLRNSSTFEALKKVVIPSVFEENAREKNFSIKILSLGCASGEEPYSLAIILCEHFSPEIRKFSVSITATDIDDNMIIKGKEGVYSKKSLKNLSESIIDKYFYTESDEKFRVSRKIKKMVSFKHKDILDDKELSIYDLILCRNMLIYFPRNQQEIILAKLSGALREGGFLVIGKSETLMHNRLNLFKIKCSKERIYKKLRQ